MVLRVTVPKHGSKEERAAFWESLSPAQRRLLELQKANEKAARPDFGAGVAQRARERMRRVDEFPSDVRAVVYEHGLEVVQEFWNHGVRKGKSIAYLIGVARGDDFPNGQTRFRPNGRAKSNPLNHIPPDATEAACKAYLLQIDGGATHEIAMRMAIKMALGKCGIELANKSVG